MTRPPTVAAPRGRLRHGSSVTARLAGPLGTVLTLALLGPLGAQHASAQGIQAQEVQAQGSEAQGSEQTASPEESLTWSVRPAQNEHGDERANYSYALEPGTGITDALVVQNLGSAAVTLGIATADGYTTPAGRLDLYPADVESVDLGAWVVPEVSEITLSPGQSSEVAFTLDVPEDAAPGDHTGGILTVHSSADASNLQFDRRLAVRIHVRVPGEQLVDLQVSEVQVSQRAGLNPFVPGTVEVTYTVTNLGNVRTLYHERISAYGPGGMGHRQAQDLVEEILPGSHLERTSVVQGVWPLGRTSVDLEVLPEAVDGEVGTAVLAHAQATAVPWPALVLLIVVIATAVTIGVLRAGRGNRGDDSADATRPAGHAGA